jgi:hypothetical protein
MREPDGGADATPATSLRAAERAFKEKLKLSPARAVF